MQQHRLHSLALLANMVAAVLLFTGCTVTPREYFEALKGEGFPGYAESATSNVRGNTKEAKPSGYFTDRRSEQIEKSLGGSF